MHSDNKVLLARLFEEGIHRGNLTIVDEVFATDCRFVPRSENRHEPIPNQVSCVFGLVWARGYLSWDAKNRAHVCMASMPVLPLSSSAHIQP
jgi:hypothetical protein